jgi:hypothetical protein
MVACFSCHSVRSFRTFDPVVATSDASASSAFFDRQLSKKKRKKDPKEKKRPKSKWHSHITVDWKVLECSRSKSLNEFSQIVGDSKLAELRGGVGSGGGGGGIGEGERGELRGDDDIGEGEGEGLDLDLVRLLERRGFDLIGLLGGLGGQLLRFLGSFRDQVRNGDGVREGLGSLGRFFCKALRPLPYVFHGSPSGLCFPICQILFFQHGETD